MKRQKSFDTRGEQNGITVQENNAQFEATRPPPLTKAFLDPGPFWGASHSRDA